MIEPTKRQILDAMAQGVADLIDPVDDELDAIAAETLDGTKVLYAPPLVGCTVTSQALNKWLTQAIHAAPGIDFTTDHLATTTRVAAFIRDPKHLQTFLLDELSIDLVRAPIIDLPEVEGGKFDNSRAALASAVLAAALEFHVEFDDGDVEVESIEDMASALYGLYASDEHDVARHPMIEVFQYWDLMPDETLFEWVLQYFLCVQTENDYAAQLVKQQEAKRVAAQKAIEAAATDAVSGATLSTVTRTAALPATS